MGSKAKANEIAPQLSAVDGIVQLSFLVSRIIEARAAEHSVSIIQTRLLGILRDRTPTINELAKLLVLDKSSVSGLVDRAERRGLVVRAPSPTDGRAVLVELTDQGRAVIGEAAQELEADVAALLGPLPKQDRRTLLALISRLLAAHAEGLGIDLFPSVGTSG